MKTSMLEYVKTVLDKVSFNKTLFVKEYKKSKVWLAAHEAMQLEKWLQGRGYYHMVNEVRNPGQLK